MQIYSRAFQRIFIHNFWRSLSYSMDFPLLNLFSVIKKSLEKKFAHKATRHTGSGLAAPYPGRSEPATWPRRLGAGAQARAPWPAGSGGRPPSGRPSRSLGGPAGHRGRSACRTGASNGGHEASPATTLAGRWHASTTPHGCRRLGECLPPARNAVSFGRN